jgi:hypothetical protein
MRQTSRMNRRDFVTAASAVGAGVVLEGQGVVSGAVSVSTERQSNPVTPAEDLMFEHGLVERLLLIYGRPCDRIEAGMQVPALLLFSAASIVHSFVEE